MIWFVRDFDLLSLLLRALSFALEALAFGGVFFLLFAARPANLDTGSQARLRRAAAGFALALAVTQISLVAATSAVLMGSSGMGLRDVISAAYFVAGTIFIAASLALFLLLRLTSKLVLASLSGLIALDASVSLSHAASRMDHRPLLLVLTAAHHLGMAAWIGAMPFLLLALRLNRDVEISRRMARRFSTMAVIGVATLIAAGVGLSWFYAGSWRGMYGTSYGLLLSAKIVLTVLILTLGPRNFFLLRRVEQRTSATPVASAPLQRDRTGAGIHGDSRGSLSHRAVAFGG